MKYIISERQYKLLHETEMKFRRRFILLSELIEKEISELLKDGGIEFSNRIEFEHFVINGVMDAFYDIEGSSDIESDELQDFITDNFGDYILSMYPHDDEDEFEDDDEEDEF